MSLVDAVEAIKISSRRYAKRQLTWFRAKDTYRLFLDDENGVMREYSDVLAELISTAKQYLNENTIKEGYYESK